MLNIFDLSTGITGSKMPTEKSRRNGSPVRRGHPNVVKKDTNAGQVNRNLRRASEVPVKMLTSHETCKEKETGRSSPGVIAKLMGLDSLPVQSAPPVQPSPSVSSIIIPKSRTKNSYTIGEAILGYQPQQESAYPDEMLLHDVRPFHDHIDTQVEYKDIYEVRKQPSRANSFKNELSLEERYGDYPREKMDLVHLKFMEAKRLAMNHNQLHSKEFHDALEVLSSNKEMFLKFLEEPQTQAVLPSRRKCITLLRPSNFIDMTSKKQLSEEMLAEVSGGGSNRLNQGSGRSYSNLGSLSHPTRIVVLKPSPRKFHEIKLPVLHQRPPKGKDDFFDELGSVETTKSREVAKEIAWHMRESISNRKDEKLLFPAMSNGYTGDDSSFSRSEIAYMEEESGIFSDSQAMTPTSQCSWDHINQYGSPYSPSSHSRASYVTESSLTLEAKKRLSDRLAMVTTNGGSQEYKQLRRSSSTLAEMLSFSDTTKGQAGKEDYYILSGRDYTGNCGLKIDSSHLCSNRDFAENAGEKLPTSLQRSSSVPVSSSAHDVPDLGMEGSNSHLGDKGITKSKRLKFSLKEKVSSLFSRNKKQREETIIPPVTPRPPHKVPSVSDSCSSEKVNPLTQIVDCCKPEEETRPSVEESPNKNLVTLQHHFLKEGSSFAKEDLSVGKSSLSEIPSRNAEQPSPVSVLEAVFDEDSCTTSQTRDVATPECERAIARSPLIDSSARTLSWDESACPEETCGKPWDSPIDSPELDVEEQERLDFVKSLIQASGLHNETPNTVQSKWYSPETPLNPSLLDKFVQRKEEGAKCRERRSSQKLLFDCVNAALLEIGQTNFPDSCLSIASNFRICNSNPLNNSVMEEVSLRIIRWFSADEQWSQIDYSSFAVDYVIKKEVNGRGWEEKVRSEITLIVRDIERDILNELVAATMDGLITSACKEDNILALSPYH